MATIGQPLVTPEAGWQRFDSTNSYFVYSGAWETTIHTNYYTGSILFCRLNGKVSFKFYGTKLRIITDANSNHSNDVQISIDGQVDNFSIYTTNGVYQRLSYEKVELPLQVHTVEITNMTNDSFGFDAIDIDDTGALQLFSEHGLLRITMSDSSEREYELSNEQINKFVAWCDRAVGTGTTLYAFDKLYNIGEFKSREEYLMFDKIISFEVMALTK